jgi:hypothetical protein
MDVTEVIAVELLSKRVELLFVIPSTFSAAETMPHVKKIVKIIIKDISTLFFLLPIFITPPPLIEKCSFINISAYCQ